MRGNIAHIDGIPINSGCFKRLLEEIAEAARGLEQVRLVFTPNPEFLLKAHEDENFKKILQSADINLPDGFGLVLWSRLAGWGIRERVAGADMVRALLSVGNKEKWRVGLVGLRGGDGRQADDQIRRLKQLYPEVIFVDLSNDQVQNSFQLIFACQGMVRQEIWIWENKDKYKAGVMMGIGGSLDFLTGFTKRAPVWWRNLGLEWLWRVGQKPRHIKRVVAAVFKFSWLVIGGRVGIDR